MTAGWSEAGRAVDSTARPGAACTQGSRPCHLGAPHPTAARDGAPPPTPRCSTWRSRTSRCRTPATWCAARGATGANGAARARRRREARHGLLHEPKLRSFNLDIEGSRRETPRPAFPEDAQLPTVDRLRASTDALPVAAPMFGEIHQRHHGAAGPSPGWRAVVRTVAQVWRVIGRTFALRACCSL
jgi:hypothetical protein